MPAEGSMHSLGVSELRASAEILRFALDGNERKVLSANLSAYFLSVSASTPGSFFPSRNSSEAPPPVEMCVILSATLAA